MNIIKESISPSESGADPWGVEVSNGSVTVGEQSVSVPDKDCNIGIDSDGNLTIKGPDAPLFARLAWRRGDKLHIVEFVE